MKPARNMFACCTILLSFPLAAQTVNVTVQPAQPALERSLCCILINVDFELRTPGTDTLTLEAIQAVLFDSRGKQLGVRLADRSGTGSGVVALRPASAVPGRVTTVATPFPSIDHATPIASVQYTLRFRGPHGTIESIATVSPVSYVTKSDLVVPVEGRIVVQAGRESGSPRSGMDRAIAQELSGVRRQFNRYAYDFMVSDSAGALNRTGGASTADWYGFGATVVAPAAGVVRVAENNEVDHSVPNSPNSPASAATEANAIPGNYIVIDHENGECSLLAHLKRGTQSVQEGDRVTRGQRIAEVGLSGDSRTVPHLHYQLMDSCDFRDAEGLPSRFSAFNRLNRPNDGMQVKAHVGPGEILLVRPYFKR